MLIVSCYTVNTGVLNHHFHGNEDSSHDLGCDAMQ